MWSPVKFSGEVMISSEMLVIKFLKIKIVILRIVLLYNARFSVKIRQRVLKKSIIKDLEKHDIYIITHNMDMCDTK